MGKGHRRCEVCGIKEGRHTVNNLFFSKFPLDPNRCREWLKVIGNDELVDLPIEKLHEQRNVCANHFRTKDFNKKGNRLKRHAIPTLNLMALPLTDAQLAEFPLHVYWHSESKDNLESSTVTVISQETTGDEDISPSSPCSVPDFREGNEKTLEDAIPRQNGIMRKRQQILETKKASKKIIPTKRSRKYAKKVIFDKMTKKLNPLARKLMWMQISQCNKKQNGYRFTDEEKAIGLSIWKQSPDTYKFLRSIFILPSLKTILSVKSKSKVESEKNQLILQTIETEEVNEQSQENIDVVYLELGL